MLLFCCTLYFHIIIFVTDLKESDVVADYSRKHSPLYVQLEGRITFVDTDETDKAGKGDSKDNKMTCGATALRSGSNIMAAVCLFLVCFIFNL